MGELRTLEQILRDAKAATVSLQMLSSTEKNAALEAMAAALEESAPMILQVNADDLEKAKERISPVMTDRLRLNAARIAAMVKGIRDTVALPDPVGEVTESVTRPNGLTIDRVRVPFGVVAVIYESRPNVTSDAAVQLDLFTQSAEQHHKSKALMGVLDRLTTRYGMDSVRLASQSAAEEKPDLTNFQPLCNQTTDINDIIEVK